jgi:hypothetical protein
VLFRVSNGTNGTNALLPFYSAKGDDPLFAVVLEIDFDSNLAKVWPHPAKLGAQGVGAFRPVS